MESFPHYSYDLARNLTSETYPSLRVVNFSYDAANRPTQIQDQAKKKSYLSNISYSAVGDLASFNYHNGLARTITPNSRWQPQEIKDASSAGTLLDLAYTWDSTNFHNNGSVVGQTITTPGAMFAQTYGYDALNRINSITDTARAGTALQRTFGYDSFGNNWISSTNDWFPVNQLTPTLQAAYSNASDQLGAAGDAPYGYNANGNLTKLGAYALSYSSSCYIGRGHQFRL